MNHTVAPWVGRNWRSHYRIDRVPLRPLAWGVDEMYRDVAKDVRL